MDASDRISDEQPRGRANRSAATRGFLLLSLLTLCIAAGCKDCGKQQLPPRPVVGGAPFFPIGLDVSRYTGAAVCGSCHREAYEVWRRSPHGRAMALPSKESVLGDFDAPGIEVDGRRVTPLRDARGWAFRIDDPSGRTPPEEHRVELVLASGRQHQIYLSRGSDGALRPLPIYWAIRAREWIDIKLHRGASLDPAHPLYWQKSDVVSEGNCFYCHLSQGRARADGKRVEQDWVDLPVNCESCHGPGREHAEARMNGRAEPRMPDLRLLQNVDEGRLCGRCHASQRGGHPEGSRELLYMTLAAPLFRSDGTQFGAGYQWAGHVTSGCYVRGAMTCSACHDPHKQTARSIAGEDAEGARSDRQCDFCHRDLRPDEAARAHSHHAAPRGAASHVRCIDCHMPRFTLFDDQGARQEVSDHGIRVPRPRHTVELGLPNACTRCHAEHDAQWALDALARWGQQGATTTTPWIAAISHARRRARNAPGSPEAGAVIGGLLAALTARGAPELVQASVLDLLGEQAPDARVPAAVAPFTTAADPYLRGLALRALWTHDVDRREAWVEGAVSDGALLTRLVALDAPVQLAVPVEAVTKLERDVVSNWTVPPTLALRELALMHARAGRYAHGLTIADKALKLATPRQLEMGRLPELRARLAQDAAASGVAPGR